MASRRRLQRNRRVRTPHDRRRPPRPRHRRLADEDECARAERQCAERAPRLHAPFEPVARLDKRRDLPPPPAMHIRVDTSDEPVHLLLRAVHQGVERRHAARVEEDEAHAERKHAFRPSLPCSLIPEAVGVTESLARRALSSVRWRAAAPAQTPEA